MKNDLFSIGPFTVHGYGLMIAIGVLSAYYMVEYRAKKKQMDWEKVFPLTVWSVLGGFLGSKILYLLTRLPDILANPALLGSSIKDGFVVYGGIIGGILTAWIYCKCTKWNFWKIFDIAMLFACRLLLRNRAGSRKPDRDRVPQFRLCTK